LIEIAGCGRDSHPVVSKEVRTRFSKALAHGGRFFVPLPCLFELGDHIADVKHDELRCKLVQWLYGTVESCLAGSKPWSITPTQKPEDVLPPLMDCFVPFASKQRIGLVDSFTAEEAMRLKTRFKGYKGSVHIWTNDGLLKKMEPDEEKDAYLWKSDGAAR
jgi:hypothetical protein